VESPNGPGCLQVQTDRTPIAATPRRWRQYLNSDTSGGAVIRQRAQLSADKLLAQRGEKLVKRANRARSLAHCGRNPLHRAEAHVAGREDSGPGRFER
jgi:hypothetical protein